MSFLQRIWQRFLGVRPGPGPGENAHTPRVEAERLATEWAERNRRRMSRPMNATYKVVRGRPIWEVESNYGGKGHRIFVTVDDATGVVVGHDEIMTR